ncbi:hypothetical protein Q7P37_000232 [Cladosporium fusiforme]
MHLKTALVLPCLVAGVLGETHQIKGSLSKFKAVSSVEGKDATEKVYQSCKELDQYGNKVSDGSVCVSKLLELTFLAMTAGEDVMLIKNNTVLDAHPTVEAATDSTTAAISSQSTAPENYGANSKRNDVEGDEMLLKRMNDRISQRSRGEHPVRVVHVGASDVHPRDGIAVRTDVRSEDAVLHVHTNGSHATAAFERSASLQLDRRDEVTTQRHKYQFSEGAKGIKMQLQWAEDKDGCDVSPRDLGIFASAFGFGDGKAEPAFKESDSWKYVVCDTKDSAKLFHGKLISQTVDTDLGYEGGDDSMDCE